MVNNPPPRTVNIAIVGAGYAGLALANLLQKNTTLNVVVFDALHPPTPGTLVGQICVPVVKRLYRELDWKFKFPLPTSSHDGLVVQQEDLLQDLRRNVTVRHHCVCDKLEGGGALLVWNRKTGERSRYPLSFDLVVVCTGVRNDTLRIPISDPNVVFLGDARATTILLDFGRSRIRQGANEAMQDAMEVAAQLATGNPQDWGKFSYHHKQRQVMKVRLLLACGIAFLAGLIRYQYMNNDEDES